MPKPIYLTTLNTVTSTDLSASNYHLFNYYHLLLISIIYYYMYNLFTNHHLVTYSLNFYVVENASHFILEIILNFQVPIIQKTRVLCQVGSSKDSLNIYKNGVEFAFSGTCKNGLPLIIIHITKKYWIGVQEDQSYNMERRCFSSLL